jgi:electron transfer flavoprotein beta subunit
VTVAILLRRLQGRPSTSAEDEALGRCERAALVTGQALAAARGTAAIAIAVGPARREDRVLAMALRAGCDRAVRVSDDGLDELDYLGLATVLAAILRKVEARCVICGDRAEEEGTGAIGPAVAELLDAAHLTGIVAVAVEKPGRGKPALLVERQADGAILDYRVELPAVLCVRPSALRGRLGDDEPARPARGTGIEQFGLAQLGLDPRALGHRRGAAGRLRPVRGPRRTTMAASAADLIGRLRAEHLVPPAAPPAPPAEPAAAGDDP